MFSSKPPFAMVLMIVAGLFCLVASVPLVQAKGSDFESIYRIVPRGSHRRMIDPEDEIISFDGDMSRIQQLALEEAIKNMNAAGMNISESPSLGPTAFQVPTHAPSGRPSSLPSTERPSLSPVQAPSGAPSKSSMPSDMPSFVPTNAPTKSAMPSDAPSLVPSQQPSSPTTAVPRVTQTGNDDTDLPPGAAVGSTPFSSTSITCDNAQTSNLQSWIVTWQYSVETVPIFNKQTVIDSVERVLAREIKPLLMDCFDDQVPFSFDVQAIDQQPSDTASSTDVCTSETGTLACTVYDGQMRVFMPEGEDANYVFFQARTAIQSILNDPSFPSLVVGLVKAEYLGPPIVTPSSAFEEEEPEPFSDINPEDQNLGLTSLVLVTVGSAALIVFVGSVYYMRRDSGSSTTADGNATQAAGSSVNDHSYFPSPRPTSPFSEMLPMAYRYNENMSILSGGVEGLEMVMENSDGEIPSPQNTDASSILVSDSGYTTDAGEEEDEEADISLSFDVPRSLYTRVTESPRLLGARRRRESIISANSSVLDRSLGSDDGDDNNDDDNNDDTLLVWTPSKESALGEDPDEDDDELLILV